MHHLRLASAVVEHGHDTFEVLGLVRAVEGRDVPAAREPEAVHERTPGKVPDNERHQVGVRGVVESSALVESEGFHTVRRLITTPGRFSS